jgi:hypothetical protein
MVTVSPDRRPALPTLQPKSSLTGKKAIPHGRPGAEQPAHSVPGAPPDLTIPANVQTGFTDASKKEVQWRAGLGPGR